MLPIPSCPTLPSRTTAWSQHTSAGFVSLRTVPRYSCKQGSKATSACGKESCLASERDFSLQGRWWHLPRARPTLTRPSAKTPLALLSLKLFPACFRSSVHLQYQQASAAAVKSAAAVCWKVASLSVFCSLGPHVCNSCVTCTYDSGCSKCGVRFARRYLPALESYTEVSKLPGRADLKPTSQVKGTAAS